MHETVIFKAPSAAEDSDRWMRGSAGKEEKKGRQGSCSENILVGLVHQPTGKVHTSSSSSREKLGF